MDRNKADYVHHLAKRVLLAEISASRAVVLLHMYDHPEVTFEAAALACGVPLSCASEVLVEEAQN